MVRNANSANTEKLAKYEVRIGGQIVSRGMVLPPSMVKKLESMGYRLKKVNVPVTRRKARTILEHGQVQGYRLTPKQRRFFGARASGKPVKRTNPEKMTLIYKDITRIEGTKGKDSLYPGEKFYHNFHRPYPSMYGTPDRKKLIIK